jgi:Ser/Thr protein kinase RdoA (MazF antagonist)
VTQFLQSKGLTTQTVLMTREGKLWVEDDEAKPDAAGNTWRWRLLLGVEGEFFDRTSGPAMAEEAGRVLGQMDATLATYPGTLEPGRKSFHYTVEIEKLNQYQKQFAADADEKIRGAAVLLRTEMPKLLLPEDLPKSIIHADPKVSNFLFTKDGAGIGMIDFDTLQLLSPLFEVADAVRSWCGGEEDDPENTFEKSVYESLLQGYLSTSKGLLSEREQSLIPQACKLVMLGLASRFLNDYIDDSYFGWDETRYNSRKDHNKARALGQISLYQSFIKLT